MDTISIARKKAQFLIDRYNESEWNCLTVRCGKMPKFLHVENCTLCPFNMVGTKLNPRELSYVLKYPSIFKTYGDNEVNL